MVGAGAAGIALAREFLGTAVRVIVVESGGRRPSSLGDSLNDGEVAGLAPDSLREGRERVLGGTTALWAGQCLPPEPSTFAQRSWVPNSGWPIAASSLEPFLRRAEQLFQIEGEVYDERIWAGFGVEPAGDRPRPPRAPLHGLVPRAAPRAPLPARPGRGRQRARAAARDHDGDRHDARRRSVRVRAGRGPGGGTATIRARACVLCCGAVENARLMLASGVGQRPRRALLRGSPQRPLRADRERRRGAAAAGVRAPVPRAHPLPAAAGADPRARASGAGALVRRLPGLRLRGGLRHRGGPARLPGDQESAPPGAARNRPGANRARRPAARARRPTAGSRGGAPPASPRRP